MVLLIFPNAPWFLLRAAFSFTRRRPLTVPVPGSFPDRWRVRMAHAKAAAKKRAATVMDGVFDDDEDDTDEGNEEARTS
jgi:hypothetical protein